MLVVYDQTLLIQMIQPVTGYSYIQTFTPIICQKPLHGYYSVCYMYESIHHPTIVTLYIDTCRVIM